MENEHLRCEGCQTPTCFTPWPDDDHPSFAGKMRGCFGSNARSVGIESPDTWRINALDKTISSDNDAYRRLRKDGLQPDTVKGSAKLEADLS